MTDNIIEKILSYLGFARRSGKAETGAELVLSAVRKASSGKRNDSITVLLASDSSERTRKQISDKCSYYNVFCRVAQIDSESLSKALGKSAPISAVAVTDKSLAMAIQKLYQDR